MAQESEKIADGELAAAGARLRALFGRIWDQALEDPERRFLACALRCLGEDGLARYAGLELGLAVQWSLGHRLFDPLRKQWRAHYWAEGPGRGAPRAAERFGVPDDERGLAAPLVRFLDGQLGALDLGPMLIWLQKAIKVDSSGQTQAERELRELVGGFLAALLPNPPPLPAPAPEVRKRRAQDLESLRQLRNECAHPHKAPTRERLDRAWQTVAADAEDAFYRYFGLALLAPGDAG